MSRTWLIRWCPFLIVGSFVCWFFPLFHLRPFSGAGKSKDASLQVAKQSSGSGTLASGNPTTIEPRQLAAYATGTEITQFWQAFDADATAASTLYGRQAGLGGAWYFLIGGRGIVEMVDNDRVVLSIADSPRRVCLLMGVVVDNTVREAIGVKASDFANSQDFNAVSAELNHRVDQEVIAPNRALLKEGVVVQFVGCAKISGKSDLDPLCLVPIQIKTSDSERGTGFSPAQATNGSTRSTEARPTESTP